MAKKKKLIKLTDSRPKISCYASPPALLRVGHDQQCYYIPEFMLQSLKNYSSSSSGSTIIDLVNVDAGTGHVIAHFLYTGTYQTLAVGTKSTFAAKATTAFRQAILAFVAASKYGLTALQELAKAEAVQWGEEVSIVEAIQAINEDSLMGREEAILWFQDIILQKTDQALTEEGGILFTDKFFSDIKNSKLAKLLAQRATNHHLERISMLRKFITTSEDGVTAPVECVVEDIQGKPLPAPSNEPIQSLPAEPSTSTNPMAFAAPETATKEPEPNSPSTAPGLEGIPAPEPQPEAKIVEEFTSSISDPVVEAVEKSANHVELASEPVTEDPWAAFSATKTKKKKKKGRGGLSEEPVPDPTIESVPEIVRETVHESVPEPVPEPIPEPIPEIVPEIFHETVHEPDPEPVPEPAEAENDGWGSFTWGVNTKKKKKKQIAAIEEAENDPWGSVSLNFSKKKKKKEAPPPAPDVDWDVVIAKFKEKKILEEAAKEAAPDPADIDWGFLPSEIRTKKKKKGLCMETFDEEPQRPKVEEELVAVPETEATLEPVFQPVPEVQAINDFAGLSKSQKRKLEKKMKMEQEAAEDEARQQAREEEEAALAGLQSITQEVEPPSKIQGHGSDDDCPLRHEHLSRGGVWNGCAQCELYLRRVALKLHGAGTPGFDGLEVS